MYNHKEWEEQMHLKWGSLYEEYYGNKISQLIYIWLWKEVKNGFLSKIADFIEKIQKKTSKIWKKKFFNAPEKIFYQSYDHVQGI